MKIDMDHIRLNYLPNISRAIDYWMWRAGDTEKEWVINCVFTKLERKGEIRGEHREKSLWQYIWRVTRSCYGEYYRRVERAGKKRNRYLEQRMKDSAKQKKRNKWLLKLQRLESKEVEVLNADIVIAYCSGRTRKKLAEQFGISERAMKGRLEYTKKWIEEKLRKIERRERLKARYQGK